jgi:enamine deaminase RidA (YjgF/YER057c/UK114 family)
MPSAATFFERECLAITALGKPEWLVEIEVTAVIPD